MSLLRTCVLACALYVSVHGIATIDDAAMNYATKYNATIYDPATEYATKYNVTRDYENTNDAMKDYAITDYATKEAATKYEPINDIATNDDATKDNSTKYDATKANAIRVNSTTDYALTDDAATDNARAEYESNGKAAGNATQFRFTEVAASMGRMWHCLVNNRTEPKMADVRFYLYTRRNRHQPEELFVSAQHRNATRNMSNSSPPPSPRRRRRPAPLHPRRLDPSAPLKVILHGYTGSVRDPLIISLKRAYLSRYDCNVLLVDWHTLAKPPCYNLAASYCKFVGDVVAKLIDVLPVPLSSIHIVGYSLGAHVAGFAGNRLLRGTLDRITGLDPALPYFSSDDRLERLDRTDARFVDVIHTNAGMLGQAVATGHADYYPNGGARQPGCEASDLYCDHDRAAEYFLESITSAVAFRAVGCPSLRAYRAGACDHTGDVAVMGDRCSEDAIGMYFLRTESDKPFALG